uniref:Diacylglycerol O-acyltransferase n=1 Tax=Phaeomonas parva TaxID=124430 RepID=A0A7S1XVI2_9STRA|mmetsp:Transcript_36701/g.114947  ORF Transcript_36701/g.114947 Transcript_36701/m.114947 type:complete len:425 (+) Transcript_36701:275-1549(+)
MAERMRRTGMWVEPAVKGSFHGLNQLEHHPMIFLWPGITTTNFYEGKPPVEALRAKLRKIVALNPWLAGRMQRDPSEGVFGGLKLWVPADPLPFLDSIFHGVKKLPKLDRDSMTYQEICAILDPFNAPCGLSAFGQDKSLFHVTLIQTGKKDEFALHVSMSHSIGDGATYYSVLNMLSEDAVPYAMLYDRVDISAWERRAVSEPFFLWMWGLMINVSHLLCIVFGGRWRTNVLEVSTEWVQQRKDEHERTRSSVDVPFISTNDVVTSELSRNSRCDMTHMLLNFRGRNEKVKSSRAGNYEGFLTLWCEESNRPQGIRRALTRPDGRFIGQRKDAPDFHYTVVRNMRLGVTSWASFYDDVLLPGAKLLLHLPIWDLPVLPVHDLAVIFRPSKGRVAVLSHQRGPHALLQEEAVQRVLVGDIRQCG